MVRRVTGSGAEYLRYTGSRCFIGLGAFTAPLVATYWSTARHWSFHYVIAAGIAVSNLAVLTGVFRFRRQEGAQRSCMLCIAMLTERRSEVLAEAGQEQQAEPTTVDDHGQDRNQYGQIMRQRVVQLLALFCLIYVGVEVTLGGENLRSSRNRRFLLRYSCAPCIGWIVTFIQDERGGNASAGYISSGFFGGT